MQNSSKVNAPANANDDKICLTSLVAGEIKIDSLKTEDDKDDFSQNLE